MYIMLLITRAYAGLRGALGIALSIEAARIAYDDHEPHIGDQIFFFVTYLSSLTLLINGTAAEYVIVKLGLVTDPAAPLDLFKKFIRRTMEKGAENHLLTYFEENKEELGDFDLNELVKFCPSISKVESAHESSNLSRNATEETEVDLTLLNFIRATFLQLLLYSIDVAAEEPGEKLNDWATIVSAMKPNRLEAVNERLKLYVIINYIEAHEFAQHAIHSFLSKGIFKSCSQGQETLAPSPEEEIVLKESQELVEKAKAAQRTIKEADVVFMGTLRAANVLLRKHEEIISAMFNSGELSDIEAEHQLGVLKELKLAADQEQNNVDKHFITESRKRKRDEKHISHHRENIELSEIHNKRTGYNTRNSVKNSSTGKPSKESMQSGGTTENENDDVESKF
eukprot:gene24130-32547_t